MIRGLYRTWSSVKPDNATKQYLRGPLRLSGNRLHVTINVFFHRIHY